MPHRFQPGQILLDKYRVERVLGAGGMGVVVAARHLALDDLVAIKFMLGSGTSADLTRFVREARAAVRLKSQHVARVLDVAALEDGTPYMVLEHLDGGDFAHVLRERGPLPVAEAVDAILQASEAIAEAHSIGIIHRDIKPANLFLTRGADGSPCVKVLDFGIAKWTNASTAKMDPSQPMGSAPYMAPEQFAATTLVDGRTDVWALGATLFHLLTSKTPFHYGDIDSIQAMMHAVLHRPPMRLRSLREDLSAALEEVLEQCLAKDQSHRFPSVAALAAVLAPFGSEQAVVYSRRVAKVLGEPEPNARVASIPEMPTAPVPPLVAATTRLPESPPAIVEASSAGQEIIPAPASTSPLVASPSKAKRNLVVPLAAVVATAIVGICIGSRIGRAPASSEAAAPSTTITTPSPPTSTPTASPSAAATIVDIPVVAETTSATAPVHIASPPPPRKNTPPLPAAPTLTATPKENLYGRRR